MENHCSRSQALSIEVQLSLWQNKSALTKLSHSHSPSLIIMKRPLLLSLFVGLLLNSSLLLAEPIEILAIGASQTNGRGVDPASTYPAQLETLLRTDGYDVTVKNAGIDGDSPFNVYSRMTRTEVNEHTKIVILEQSSNESNTSSAIEFTEKALAWLQDHHIPSIFISNVRIQPIDDARLMAKKYGATYYGGLMKDIPHDSKHIQQGEFFLMKNKLDYHLTPLGYGVIASNMATIVKKVIAENHLGEPKK